METTTKGNSGNNQHADEKDIKVAGTVPVEGDNIMVSGTVPVEDDNIKVAGTVPLEG